MLKFYGPQPPAQLPELRLGGYCPHCKTGTRFKRTTEPIWALLYKDNTKLVVINYTCEVCLGPIPVRWEIYEWLDANSAKLDSPQVTLPMREEFNFKHVPESVKKEIDEALNCLSVSAYNGFAAICRRAIQAICTNLGAGATSKVETQIKEMVSLTGLDKNWKELAIQIMLSGHNGSHPDLPDVNAERAAVLLSLLRDLTYELYTRPGKIKDSAGLRKEAIQNKKDKEG